MVSLLALITLLSAASQTECILHFGQKLQIARRTRIPRLMLPRWHRPLLGSSGSRQPSTTSRLRETRIFILIATSRTQDGLLGHQLATRNSKVAPKARYCPPGATLPSSHQHQKHRRRLCLDKPLPSLPCGLPSGSLLVSQREPSKVCCYYSSISSPQHKHGRAPSCLDKPLPPLPCDLPPISLTILEGESGRWYDGPAKSLVRVDKSRVRPDSVTVEYEYDTGGDEPSICESPMIEEED